MKLREYNPTFTGVLIKEVKAEKTKGGIYIPSLVSNTSTPDEKVWRVEKVGKECSVIKPKDIVYLSAGVYPEPVGEYFQVIERQIKGYEREN